MSNYPQPPQCVSGLDTSGQFHIGDGITLAVDGPYIRILCGKTRAFVTVTGESIANTLERQYFGGDHVIA
jgi:hypothetical protein